MLVLDASSSMVSFILPKRRIERNLVEIVREAASNGVKGYEFGWWKGNENLDTLEAIQKDLGIICVGFQLSSPERLRWWEATEKEIVNCMRPQIETAERLNASRLFVNLGLYDFENESIPSNNLRKAFSAVTTMGSICSDAGFRLCLEPVAYPREEAWGDQYEWSRVRCPMEISAELIAKVDSSAVAAVYCLYLFERGYVGDPADANWANWSLALDDQAVENFLVPDLRKHHSIIGHIRLSLVSNSKFGVSVFDEIFTAAVEQAPVFRGISEGRWRSSESLPLHIGLHFVWPGK